MFALYCLYYENVESIVNAYSIKTKIFTYLYSKLYAPLSLSMIIDSLLYLKK